MSDLYALIAERLPGQRFGVYFSTGEGTFFPDGTTEESSGCVVTADEQHFHYWTEWEDGREIIGEWCPIRINKRVRSNKEYQRALAAARTTTAEGGGE